MLIRRQILDKIKSGEISVVFRKWKRPSVKSGGTLKTAVGVLSIASVENIEEADISADDIRHSEFKDRRSLLGELGNREGQLFRIRVGYAGEDPRLTLREDTEIGESGFEDLRAQLQRYDRASKQGAWTLKVLRLISRFPRLSAGELAERSGYGKQWLKVNVRKLKNLGLTVSHHPGYEISARGKVILTRLSNRT